MRKILFLMFLVCIFAMPAKTRATTYTYTELLPPGWTLAEAKGINGSGAVVGSGIDNNGISKGFLYDGGIYTDMLPQNWSESVVRGLNIDGVVVGDGKDGNGISKGFLYNGGTYTEILPAGWLRAQAHSINGIGLVVGWGWDNGGASRGFLYDGATYTVILPPGWLGAEAFDLNNSGAVVGWGNDGVTAKGFLYSGGTYTGILPPGWLSAMALSINNYGKVVGLGQDGAGVRKGFLYDGGAYTDILPPNWSSAEALSITDSGAVVGWGVDDAENTKGFFYSGGTFTDILPPGWTSAYAYDVDESGTVVGYGYNSIGKHAGFIAAPTNSPPVLNSIGALWFYEGEEWTITLGAVDPDGDPITFSVMGLPSNAKIDPVTGDLTWKPNSGQVGNYKATVIVSDGVSSDFESVSVTVYEPKVSIPPGQGGKKIAMEPAVAIEEDISKYSFAKTDLESSFDIDVGLAKALPEKSTVTVTTYYECPVSADGFQIGDICFDIATSAIKYDSVEICVTYDDTITAENSLRLRHYEGTHWVDITTKQDTTANVICGLSTSLSPFVVTGGNPSPVVPPGAGVGQCGPDAFVTPTLGSTATGFQVADLSTFMGGLTGKIYIDWGDGSPMEIIAAGATSGLHTYANPGTYKIRKTTQDDQFGFNCWKEAEVTVSDLASGGFGSVSVTANACAGGALADVNVYLTSGHLSFHGATNSAGLLVLPLVTNTMPVGTYSLSVYGPQGITCHPTSTCDTALPATVAAPGTLAVYCQ